MPKLFRDSSSARRHRQKRSEKSAAFIDFQFPPDMQHGGNELKKAHCRRALMPSGIRALTLIWEILCHQKW